MHWGHAVSRTCCTGRNCPTPCSRRRGLHVFQTQGVVARRDQTALPLAHDSALALFYTAEGSHSYVPGKKSEQGLAVSNDGGVTFTKFPGNPVLKEHASGNRDPKVFWHEPTKRWVMALYHKSDEYGIYTSPDLVAWDAASTYRIPGNSECPDLFPLAVDGKPEDVRWVAWGANGTYLTGAFDGKTFTPDGGPQRHYFGAAYAGQTYDHAPDGRRVHIGWLRDDHGLEDSPFNLQMSLPMEFSLRRNAAGTVRIHAEPAPEVASLRESTKEWKNLTFRRGDPDPLADLKATRFELDAVIDADSPASEMGFRIFGDCPAIWKKADQSFTGMSGPQAPLAGRIHVRIFVDTVSMEVFVNGSYTARYLRQKPDTAAAAVVAEGGPVRFESLAVHPLRPVW